MAIQKSSKQSIKKSIKKTIKKSTSKSDSAAIEIEMKVNRRPSTPKEAKKAEPKPAVKTEKKVTTKAIKKTTKEDTKKTIVNLEPYRFEERSGLSWPTKKTKLKLISWNVNGIRAVTRKGFFDWLKTSNPDIFCLQETRARTNQVLAEAHARPLLENQDYSWYWANAEKGGYSGAATFSKYLPQHHQAGFRNDLPHRRFNSEGRVVVTEFHDFVLWNVYFPNGGRGPERVEYKLEFYEHCLELWQETRKAGKKLIICGDYNTAHKEIDLARPKENSKVSGFLPIEREFLDKMASLGYIDIFRKYDESPEIYTYWDQFTRARERNSGWRIDYFWLTEETLPLVSNAWIETNIMGSDHCPIGLELIVNNE